MRAYVRTVMRSFTIIICSARTRERERVEEIRVDHIHIHIGFDWIR
jgi:hypothetical protein